MRSEGQFNARVRKRNASGEICKSDVNNYMAYERLPTALQSFAYFLVALCSLPAGAETKYVCRMLPNGPATTICFESYSRNVSLCALFMYINVGYHQKE